MKEKLEAIIRVLVGCKNGRGPLTGIDISSQFRPEEKGERAVSRNLNAAFLLSLSGCAHPLNKGALKYMKAFNDDDSFGRKIASFYEKGLSLSVSELKQIYSEDPSFKNNFDALYSRIEGGNFDHDQGEINEAVWKVFFPEGVSLLREKEKKIELLRRKRTIDIKSPNKNPVTDPCSELLFTSNVLFTVPPSSDQANEAVFSGESLHVEMEKIKEEQQLYWYDHPTWMGLEEDESEVVHGLEGLENAIAFEKQRGTTKKDDKLTCILSLSVTHKGLQKLSKGWLDNLLRERGGFQHLMIYAFSESDTESLICDILEPAASKYFGNGEKETFSRIIGVNGQYGRHYSFLKAIALFWQIFIDERVKATFKIDLDQVFPQEILVKETGYSAFEHFLTPLWGAEGIDNKGRRVTLGMLAGALVNHHDIDKSLFTADIQFPDVKDISPDEWIFFSKLPQAISTEAEMLVRYGDNSYDGRKKCIQRVHVTGGTCGVLLDALRKFKPFTPSFVGRAEDQAYIFSVLRDQNCSSLRYLHKAGLVMRHDKENFAGNSIKAAYIDKLLGDYERILIFSKYAGALDWTLEEIKEFVDPFTGCFISRIPITVVFLRFALKAAAFFDSGEIERGFKFIGKGTSRLLHLMEDLIIPADKLKKLYCYERQAWERYYELLEKIDEAISKGDLFAHELRRRAQKIAKNCEVKS